MTSQQEEEEGEVGRFSAEEERFSTEFTGLESSDLFSACEEETASVLQEVRLQ